MPRQFLLQILFVLASLHSGKSFAQSGPTFSSMKECLASGCGAFNANAKSNPDTCMTNGINSSDTYFCHVGTSAPPAKEEPQVNSSNSKDNCLSLISQMGACYGASQEASTSCKEENDSELQATVRGIRDTTAQADQVLSATGLNGGCGVILKATNTMAGAYAAFSQTCNSKISKCVSTCEDVQNKYNTYSCDLYEETRNSAQATRLTGSLQACQSLTLQANQGAQFQNSLPDLANQAAACKAALSAPDANFCAQNPTSSLCGGSSATDCTDPAMASTTICACKGGINTTACQSAMSTSQKLGASSLSAGNSRLTGATAATGGANSLPDFGPMANEMAAGSFKNTPGEEIGGRMGGNANVGGSSGASGNGAAANGSGEAAAGINTNINGGFGRGGGGGGGWNGGTGAKGKTGGYYGGTAGLANNGLPNLNQFRPQMGYQGAVRRDLAGVVGPDGLLGPHANVWMTIKNRYNYEWRQGTLKP